MTDRRLPLGWTTTTLGEVCLPVSNIQPSVSPDLQFTYFDIGGIDNRHNRIADSKLVTGRLAPGRARQVVQRGDILFSTVRTNLRNIARVDRAYLNPIASTGFAVIRPAQGVSSEFLFYQLLSDEFLVPLHELQTGSSYPTVREKDILGQPILLPPEEEQVRIASKLNQMLDNLSAATAASHRAKHRLADYRSALIEAAIQGELSKKWRSSTPIEFQQDATVFLEKMLRQRQDRWFEHQTSTTRPNDKAVYREPYAPITPRPIGLPRNWSWATIDQLIKGDDGIAYGVVKPGRHVSDGVQMIRIKDIDDDGSIRDDSIFRISKSLAHEFRRTELAVGDILLSVMGTVGRTAIVTKEWTGSNVNRAISVIKLMDPDLAEYVFFAFRSPLIQGRFSSEKQGSAQQRINLSDLRRFAIPLPPVDEQRVIVKLLHSRLKSTRILEHTIQTQIDKASVSKQTIISTALKGNLVHQSLTDTPVIELLNSISLQKYRINSIQQTMKRVRRASESTLGATGRATLNVETLTKAWERIHHNVDALRLFHEAELIPAQVEQFYSVLCSSPKLRAAFKPRAQTSVTAPLKGRHAISTDKVGGQFRLVSLWLEDFKNLKNYSIRFDTRYSIDVVLGWNGTGKSNLFEALVLIFRDLHEWSEKNRWPTDPMRGYKVSYEVDGKVIEIEWAPGKMKRPKLGSRRKIAHPRPDGPFAPLTREQLPLPRFVFGYYSGPTNRLAEHFLPMKQAHYDRLLKAKVDDRKTLASLLAQRKFFCAETRHAKYVLLAFSYKEDKMIDAFLKDRLRIEEFVSALFIIRKPDWAKKGVGPDQFWGAQGIMRRVMERLRRFAVAPMVLEEPVSYGYKSTTEEHYFFFIPDRKSLQAFANEYGDARSFFLALESTDFSELIHDVRIQVRVRAERKRTTTITFHQMSEGEQQLLMVLGLMRFTKSHQSLILLDEPDTHLNPHWSVDYLKDLTRVMSESIRKSPEQQSSQILMATHDPLVIASLAKEQIQLLKRNTDTGRCEWSPATVDPKGLGFTGILTSEMFGFRSDLDPETLADLDSRVRLMAKGKSLSKKDKKHLQVIDQRLEGAGFTQASSDPYYAAFLAAWATRHQELMSGKQFVSAVERKQIKRLAREVLNEAIKEVERTTSK